MAARRGVHALEDFYLALCSWRCCIVACLAGLLPRTLAWWVRAHALHLGDTVWSLGSAVRRPLPVVGKPDLATSLVRHARLALDADYAQSCLLPHWKCCRVTLASW